jgi:hypothetical protein
MTAFSGETGEAPRIVTVRIRVIADPDAGTLYSRVIGTAPLTGSVSGASFIPDTTKAGATATATTWTLANKTQSLNAATFAFVATTGDLTAFTAKALTLASAANLLCTSGDVYAIVKTVATTGEIQPAGVWEISFTRNDIL